MYKGLWLTFIAVCALPLTIALLAILSCYSLIFCLVLFIAKFINRTNDKSFSDRNNGSINSNLSKLQVRHA